MIRTLLLVPVLLVAVAACQDKPDPLADHVSCTDYAGMSVTEQSETASFQLKLAHVPDIPATEQAIIDGVMRMCTKVPDGDAQAFAYNLAQAYPH